ncbi:iron-containing alcohol dehydrogenase [Falsigemmobacter faecalis]|uniref:Iron-containing alcohol dehydrogenase n=1 Tax=Falsigemmobacter faecalis TaxID=2488730 RepID=A0A3P3D4D4_9RHOB|nr:iron-containing alcohol dehydrogenase [Falsigemmobacter faecalis]RRH69273.1 iron-containing alcohol dehydrogenase [Falsigemmobacter faecalis]
METFGTIRAPRQIIFGPGQRRVLPRVAAGLGTRALVVTDARLSTDSDFLNLTEGLRQAGLAVSVDATTEPDVPAHTIEERALAAQAFAPDLVIGIGGGSCLDMAKALALLLTHGGAVQDYYGELKVPGPVLPLIAMPTTAGTGSEVTPVAVLSDRDRALKVGISSPHLIPVVAICDPELTLSCPPGLTAIAGADALTHALEAFTAKRRPLSDDLTQERVFIGKNALSDALALQAIRLIWQGLEAAFTQGADRTARSRMMEGALMAGLAFGVAGTSAAHAIQYPVGALTHTAHGQGVACLMPWALEWNRPEITAELGEIAAAMGLSGADEVIPALRATFTRIGIPPTLKALGLPEDSLPEVARLACGIERLILNNPRSLTPPEMMRLLAAAWHGDAALMS